MLFFFEAHVQFQLKYFTGFNWTLIQKCSHLLRPLLFTYVISLAPSIIPPCSILSVILEIDNYFHPVPGFWVSLLRILLSNDVEMNPGDFSNSFFSFCNWNVNSLVKDGFKRVQLLEAHNSLHRYDLISLTEVSINDAVEVPDTLMDDYTSIYKSNAANTRHGGVGLFYRNSLPLLVRNDLGFDEALVVELNFKRKKMFFTVLY